MTEREAVLALAFLALLVAGSFACVMWLVADAHVTPHEFPEWFCDE